MLLKDKWDPSTLWNLARKAAEDPDVDMTIAPIEAVIPAKDRPIDNIINEAYIESD